MLFNNRTSHCERCGRYYSHSRPSDGMKHQSRCRSNNVLYIIYTLLHSSKKSSSPEYVDEKESKNSIKIRNKFFNQ